MRLSRVAARKVSRAGRDFIFARGARGAVRCATELRSGLRRERLGGGVSCWDSRARARRNGSYIFGRDLRTGTEARIWGKATRKYFQRLVEPGANFCGFGGMARPGTN